MELTYEELLVAACTNENLTKAVKEADLDHLAYGRIDFYLDLGPNHKSLASVQRAGRGCLYVTYGSASMYLKLTAEGKVVCDKPKDKELAIIVAALVRVFVLTSYAINNRKVVRVFKNQRSNICQNVADTEVFESPEYGPSGFLINTLRLVLMGRRHGKS